MRYYQYVKNISWDVKWFMLLLISRPMLDSLYELKEVSVFASPLYYIGVLTPFAIIISIIKMKRRVTLSRSMAALSALILLNAIMILFNMGGSIAGWQTAIKVTLLVFVYLYVRVAISKLDIFVVALKSVAYGSIFVYIMIVYEVAFGRIGDVRTTAGVEQIVGLYADAVSYGLYINLAYVAWIMLYLYKEMRSKVIISVVVIVSLIGILSISHISSLAVFSAISSLALVVGLRRYIVLKAVMITAGIVIFVYAGDELLDERYQPKIQRELEVLEGSRDEMQGFHGRMTRWTYLLNDYQDSPNISKIFGIGFNLEGRIYYTGYVLINPHNDYLRMLFLSGMLGLILYLFWLLKDSVNLYSGELGLKFGYYSTVVAVLLYSITTLPTLYPSVVYFLVLIIAYAEQNSKISRVKSEA